MTRLTSAEEFEGFKGVCPECGTALERMRARTVIKNGDTPNEPTRLILENTFVCAGHLRGERKGAGVCRNDTRYVVSTELEFESE